MYMSITESLYWTEENAGHDDAHMGAVHDAVGIKACRRTDAAACREQRGKEHRHSLAGKAENGHHRGVHSFYSYPYAHYFYPNIPLILCASHSESMRKIFFIHGHEIFVS